ncbi:hypothetical protein EJ08DRAFT_205760 [Tothia fuscella]|uniref:Uncharacterized protein n=1 Tax=Tothia fuscella TaxID=1048955 RepID=A0A9P4NSP7_9PEZI|nr:hypothetical protein EJ08DRAFT_205760 [Tothia fuscella]
MRDDGQSLYMDFCLGVPFLKYSQNHLTTRFSALRTAMLLVADPNVMCLDNARWFRATLSRLARTTEVPGGPNKRASMVFLLFVLTDQRPTLILIGVSPSTTNILHNFASPTYLCAIYPAVGVGCFCALDAIRRPAVVGNRACISYHSCDLFWSVSQIELARSPSKEVWISGVKRITVW